MGAAVRPEEAAFSQAFRDVNSHVSLDASWAKVRAAIESHCGLLGKQHAVRVRNWLKKLSEEVSGAHRASFWRSRRRCWLVLLAAAVACERGSHHAPPGSLAFLVPSADSQPGVEEESQCIWPAVAGAAAVRAAV